MELADARTMLRAAEARLALAQRELGKSRIASPLTGLVVERLAERGELIQPGKPVARLIEPDPLRFIARLSDRQLATLGDRFRAQVLRVVRAADRRDAKVVRVGPEAERATHLFPVELEIANTQADWLAGSFVRAEFVSANADHVVIVPKTAVFVRFEQTFVYAAEPREKGRDRTKVVERRVQVRDLPGEPELVVVESGVSAGESVVTTGRDFVTAGSTVHVVHEQ
jgi:membrane fusion protein (multidrug efflux system)